MKFKGYGLSVLGVRFLGWETY